MVAREREPLVRTPALSSRGVSWPGANDLSPNKCVQRMVCALSEECVGFEHMFV